ncbi:TPA: hypothetical protein ACG3RW_003764 [Clostridioides difficile]|jgi:hypothetical protein
MYPGNPNYNQPAVPPLYPMDPCRPMSTNMPIVPEPTAMEPYMPMPNQMPMCPMMNPRFRQCVQLCMMQCGNYPMPVEYPMDMNYIPMPSIDINELNPYSPEVDK